MKIGARVLEIWLVKCVGLKCLARDQKVKLFFKNYLISLYLTYDSGQNEVFFLNIEARV